MRRAVFLDRDGTIVRDAGYAHDCAQISFLPRAAEAIRLLNENGYVVVVTTNQSGVARGYFSEETLCRINEYIMERLAEKGARIDKVYYCPHHVDGTVPDYKKACYCRKPNPGMIEQASRELDLDVTRSFAIGDMPLDVEAGQRAGCRTVLLGQVTPDGGMTPDHVAADLYDAVRWVVASSEKDGK